MANRKEYSEKVINAFLMNEKPSRIAEDSGLSISTVKRYKADPEFQAILNERKTEYVKGAVSKMQGTLGKCVDTLREIIDDKEVSAQVKINAIQVLFSQCRIWTETTDIMDRLTAFEEIAKEYSKMRK